MTNRSRLQRLETISDGIAIDAFFRRLEGRLHDPRVSAALDDLFRLIDEAEAAAVRALPPAEVLDIPGLDATMERLFSAVAAPNGSTRPSAWGDWKTDRRKRDTR
jgi:hypothetical protein